jgi:hypothetical protein
VNRYPPRVLKNNFFGQNVSPFAVVPVAVGQLEAVLHCNDGGQGPEIGSRDFVLSFSRKCFASVILLNSCVDVVLQIYLNFMLYVYFCRVISFENKPYLTDII